MDEDASKAAETTGRKASRVPLRADVQFRAGSRRSQVTVNDLSTHGARISFAHILRSGDRFYLKLPVIEAIEAEVVWVDQFEAGCKFVRPIHPVMFETVVRAA
jgi:PilZ domain